VTANEPGQGQEAEAAIAGETADGGEAGQDLEKGTGRLRGGAAVEREVVLLTGKVDGIGAQNAGKEVVAGIVGVSPDDKARMLTGSGKICCGT
jgi:hypothetical protein